MAKGSMFPQFPKKRIPLPPDFQEVYLGHIRDNREGGTCAASLANKMESWMHRRVARDVCAKKHSARVTLELGAGTLNQLRYEPANEVYDIVEPIPDLYLTSPLLPKIRKTYRDISEIPFGNRYDRVISIATLEHVCNLPEVVARCGLLLSEDGVFRCGIPSEGTLLWTLGWKLTTAVEFRIKYGKNYALIMKHDHVNSAKEIDEILHFFFSDLTCAVFGLCKAISFYRFYECRQPRLERCLQFVRSDNLVTG